jgi:Neuraminidase (sialidase)
MRLVSAILLLFVLQVHAADNSIVFEIEPTKEFPRNSEGSFVTLKSGRILYFYTQFFGGADDHSAARIVSVHSDDDGKTWSTEPTMILENPQGANVMSVSLLRLKSGRIAFFYLIKNTWLDCRPHVRFSDDEGKSWAGDRLMVPAPGYFVMNNDRVIQHSSGRLIAPLAFHRSRLDEPNSTKSFDARGIALWYVSDDEGLSWKEAPQWQALPVPGTGTGLQEPGLVELDDTSLFAFFRTDQAVQYQAHSTDKGKSWTAVAPGPLQSPASPATIERLPNSTNLLAIWNDHSGQFPMAKGKRTPLVAGISTDGGKTWPNRKLLEADLDGWYCYTAIHFTKDAVLLAYCAGDSKVGGLNRLRMRRIELEWLK